MITKIRTLAGRAHGRLIMIAHDDRGSVSAETVVVMAIFIAIAIAVGKLFGPAIANEAGRVAKQITGQ